VLRLTSLTSTDGMRLDETDAIALALAGLHLSVVSGQPSAISPGAHKPRSTAALRTRIADLMQR
jgi:hypothetical protein